MNRDLDIKDFLDNVKVKFSTCNAISYNFTLQDRNGEVKNTFSNSSVIADKEEKANEIIATMESYLEAHQEIARVHAEYGGIRRSQQTIADYYIRSNDDESKEQLRQQLENANRAMGELAREKEELAQSINKVKEENNRNTNAPVDIANTNYTQQMTDTMSLFAQALGVSGSLCGTDGSISRYGMGVLMQVQEKKIKDDMERNNHLQKIEAQKDEIATLKAQIAEMRREYERMEDEVDELKEYRRETAPLLEEHKKLKTKSGMIGAGLGQALGAMVAGIASKSKYGALLGIMDDQEEEQDQEQETTEEQPVRMARVQPVDE